MFSGIVQAVGKVRDRQQRKPHVALTIDLGGLDPGAVPVGASLAINGVCLTVTELHAAGVRVDLSPETVARTTLGELTLGAAVNLEPALTLASRLGGHLVAGHIDGVGRIDTLTDGGDVREGWITVPPELSRYIAVKGSICVDGVSLTVNAVNGDRFGVTLIPHTLRTTILGYYRIGQRVNLEVDLLARYLERLMALGDAQADNTKADW